MTILTKKNLALLEATEKSNSTGYAFTHLMIKDGYTWTSNGSCLYKSPIVNDDKYYPDTGTNGINHNGCILLGADLLRKAEKNIPKCPVRPILETIQVLIDDEYKHLITTDTISVNDIKTKHEDLSFPDIRVIESSWRPPVSPEKTVGLSISELETLVKIMKKSSVDVIELIVNGPDHPVRVRATDNSVTGYIMPYYLG